MIGFLQVSPIKLRPQFLQLMRRFASKILILLILLRKLGDH